MDASRSVLAGIATSEAEDFFTTGTQAYPADDPQPIGVDTPGVGNVHIFEHHGAPVVQVSRPYAAGEIPDPLKTQLREELLCALPFASRALALNSHTTLRLNVGHEKHVELITCSECKRTGIGLAVIEHTKRCRVGRVLELIDGLTATVVPRSPVPDSTRKESAFVEGEGERGPGESPRASYGEPWQYRVDWVLMKTFIYDCEGTLITSIDKADREAEEWAQHIVESVNLRALTSQAVRS